jgi:hypothetical protein
MLELKMKALTCSNSQKASENRHKAPWSLLAIYTKKTFTKSLTAQIQDTHNKKQKSNWDQNTLSKLFYIKV